jgi:hypothetical protein
MSSFIRYHGIDKADDDVSPFYGVLNLTVFGKYMLRLSRLV